MTARRVLIVCNNLGYMIHHRFHVLECLIDRGDELHIAGPGSDEDVATLRAAGLSVHLVNVAGYRVRPLADLGLIPKIRRLVKEVRPDTLHLFAIKPIVFGKIAIGSLRTADRPAGLILSLTGLGRLFLADVSRSARVLRRLFLATMRHRISGVVERVTVETASDRDEIVAQSDLNPDHVVVTKGSGIDLGQYSPASREGPISFLFAGRLLHAKGAALFIEAAQRMARDGKDACFLLAGSVDPGDPDSLTDDEVRVALATDGMSYLGVLVPEDIPALLRRIDVLCLPTSYKEGVPRSLLEAAASGCAFIACPTPGWVETMGAQSDAGWFVAEGSVEELVVAMQRAASDRDSTRAAGIRAREAIVAAGVGNRDVQERYLGVYDALAAMVDGDKPSP